VAEAAGGTGLVHFDGAGRAVMVDVGSKGQSERSAVARGRVVLAEEAFAAVAAGSAHKGDVLGVARVAGIMAAKRTADLIPLCHPLPLTAVAVRFRLSPPWVEIEAEVRTVGRTGVEMEALTAVSGAALAVYDMCKAYGRGATITDIRLVRKQGGRSGLWTREGETPWRETEVR
jgi:cyclic pyranopterin phosphate synthase